MSSIALSQRSEMSAPEISDVFDRTVAEVLGDLIILTDTETDSTSRRARG